MLQVIIGRSDHVEAKGVIEWKTRAFMEALEICICNDPRRAAVRLT